MCSPSNPVTEWLFGDDLSEKVKDMTEVNKVGQRVSHSRQFDKSRYNAPRGGRQGQKHFFDRRRFTPPHFTAEWEKLTSDKAILDSAAHYHIEFIDNAHPTQHQIPHQITFSDTEQRIIDAEITKLLEK